MEMKRALKLNADTWVDPYGDALFHFALARVNKREIAEDLVQETFLAAVQSQKRFKGQSSGKTWIVIYEYPSPISGTRYGRLVFRPRMTIRIPPSVSRAESVKRRLICSETNNTPPKPAMTGTDSWTTAACVADIPRSAIYQRV